MNEPFERREARLERELENVRPCGPEQLEVLNEGSCGRACCVNCRYWDPPEDPNYRTVTGFKDNELTLIEYLGFCRRMPPALTDEGNGHPVTSYLDWCGEFSVPTGVDDPFCHQTEVAIERLRRTNLRGKPC